uniref:Putative mucin-17 n=1 Tax=Anopheles braziliensis TaxID=58242 RepID=A0A2M3YX79_9DIPT
MNGLSTLNRLLGKRNKDVSKSTSNLSRSTTNLDAPSQYNNKVIQLPIVPNAPFEQTFRVTVLLPRDQLYVARVGAKTKLSTLLEQVCNDKLLDAQKYVFRHPADFQQGFELDMNIGEVGLSEIRLMSRKELETLRNSDYRLSTSDIFRMHQKTARETSGATSVTSSDLSRTSKTALKTTSPYSSTNSLNSADSSGVSSSSRGGTINNGHAGNGHHQNAPVPVAPARKKRVAPRPPSQNSIPEMRPVAVTHTTTSNGSIGKQSPTDDHQLFKEPQLPPYSRQNFHVSTPNLYDREPKPVDILNNNNGIGKGRRTSGEEEEQQRNGHTVVAEPNNNNHDITSSMMLQQQQQQQQQEEEEDRKNLINTKTSYSTLKNRPTSMYIIREPDGGGAALQRSSEHNGGSMMDIHQHHSRASSSCSDAKDPRDFADMPEPTPRKRLNSSAKKSKAPAPPPRAKATPVTPVPTPSPRALTRSTLDLLRDNDVAISETDSNFSSEPDDAQRNRESRLNAVNGSIHRAPPSTAHQNVSKVMLNVEDAPSSIVSHDQPLANAPTGEKKHQKNSSTSSVSIKIGGPDPVPVAAQKVSVPKPTTPIVSKVQIGNGNQPAKIPPSPGDNSSDEEIKIYNIESGKALIKKKGPPGEEKKPESVSKPTNGVPATNGGGVNGEGATADEEQWTYKLPAPPKFADSSIKANDYDERQQFYRPASTFIDNTTLRSDMLTVVSDETERIEPFIQERLQSLELNLPPELRPGVESPTSVSTDSTTHVSDIGEGPPLISSDVEDGYRVRAGDEVKQKAPKQTNQAVTELHATESTTVNVTHEAREVWLQTLEKRREKIIEGELATLSESIGGKQIKVTTPPVGPPTETVNERKSSVMNELNQLLRDGVELNHKEDADIVAANRSSLANFKISTYSSENKENIVTSTTITTTTSKVIEGQEDVSMTRITSAVVEKEVASEIVSKPVANGDRQEEKEEIIARRKTSLDTVGRKAHSLTQSSDEDDPAINRQSNGYHGGGAKKELAPVKRRSLTMLNKSPRVINRSDSFHSTRSDYIQALNSPVNQTVPSSKLQLTPRSTSYISLIGAQRWENRAALGVATGATSFNRRKSTSELSICDSPSLQSLEVIKNILNTSRKNSINNLHHTASSAVEQRATLDEEIALPSMAAIKRNSFTDISTLGQLNGKLVQLNGVGGAAGSIRKDSIEEVKVEQEEEHEKTVEASKVDENKIQIERTVEVRIEKLIVKEQHKEEKLDKRIEEPEPKELKKELSEKTVDTEPTILMEDLASESKSDDEKLQNKQHQQQSAKEPQTSVVSITTTSTVVSSTNTNDSKPSNDTDTKKWTYQGPPTISFATWNERPKIDVSIKSDRDYRFGGSSTLPRGFRNVNNVSSTKISIGPGGSSTTHTTTTMTTMSASETAAVRRTIHEVEPTAQPERFVEPSTPSSTINVPLTVSQERPEPVSSGVVNPKPFTAPPSKPAASGSSLTTINSTPTPSPPPGERLPIVRAVEYKKNVANRQSSQPVPPPVEPKPSYFYETFSRNDSTTSSTSSSIGTGSNVSSVNLNGGGTTTTISRLSLGPKPATLLQPTVRGFKSLDEATISSVAAPAARLRPVSMLDSSATTLRKTSVPMTTTENEPSSSAPNSLPFSQNTLRRTGLKEKILAKEETIAPEPVSKSTKVNGSGPAQEQSAATTAAAPSPAPAPTPKRPVSLAGPIPPPPSAPFPPVALKPTQPVVRGAIVKKSPTSPAIDPRTALLDAIRGFNKDSLRK